MCVVILRLSMSLRYSLCFFVLLFFSPLVYIQLLKKLKQNQQPLFMVRRQAGSANAFIIQRGEYDSMCSESFRRAYINHVSV